MSDKKRKAEKSEQLILVEYRPEKGALEYASGVLVDFFQNGFSFEAPDHGFRSGDILEIILMRPDSEINVSLTGQLMWKKNGWYKCMMGIQFKEIDHASRQTLVKLISDTGTHKSISEKSINNAPGQKEETSREEDKVDVLPDNQGGKPSLGIQKYDVPDTNHHITHRAKADTKPSSSRTRVDVNQKALSENKATQIPAVKTQKQNHMHNDERPLLRHSQHSGQGTILSPPPSSQKKEKVKKRPFLVSALSALFVTICICYSALFLMNFFDIRVVDFVTRNVAAISHSINDKRISIYEYIDAQKNQLNQQGFIDTAQKSRSAENMTHSDGISIVDEIVIVDKASILHDHPVPVTRSAQPGQKKHLADDEHGTVTIESALIRNTAEESSGMNAIAKNNEYTETGMDSQKGSVLVAHQHGGNVILGGKETLSQEKTSHRMKLLKDEETVSATHDDTIAHTSKINANSHTSQSRKKREIPKKTLVFPDRNILFERNSSVVALRFYDDIDRFADAMMRDPEARVRLVGHTDNLGPVVYNLELSIKRAAAVEKVLISKGIAGSRIETIGSGHARPVASNFTERGRSRNRRVEIKMNAEK